MPKSKKPPHGEFDYYEPYSDLAQIYLKLKDYKAAEEQLKKAEQFEKEHPNNPSTNLSVVYSYLGDLYRETNRPALSEEYYNKSMNFTKARDSYSEVDFIEPLASLTTLYIRQKDDRAKKSAQELIDLSESLDFDFEKHMGYMLLGQAHIIEKEYPEALNYCSLAYSYQLGECDCSIQRSPRKSRM